MKRGILYVLYISPVVALDFWVVPGTGRYCEKSRSHNAMKEKCDYDAQSVSPEEPFVSVVHDDKCRRQLLAFSEALQKSSLWAVQMFDASAKAIEARNNFGHFDECIDTNLGKDVDNIRGKYCLLDVGFGKGVTRIGICIPNECGEKQIRGILRTYYTQIPGDVEVSRSMCTTGIIPPQNTSGTCLRYAIIALLSWIAFITAVDLITPESKKLNGFRGKVTEIFSCYRNIRNLTDVKDEAAFTGVHFLKVATLSLIVFCRRYHMLKETPVKNPTYFEQEGVISVNQVSDLLIFQSGFLAVQKLSECCDIGSKRRCFTLCATRVLRLIPVYAAVIAFYSHVLEGSGNGPLWAEKTEKEARHCRDFWWANLSFINNYISSSRQCIAQSWYLAVTAHCSLLTLIFIHLKARKSFVGLGSFAVILSAAAVVFVWNDLSSAKNHLNRHDYIVDSYTKTHNRVPAYAVGSASAFLCNYIKKSKDVTPRFKILLITFAFGICGLISIISSSISQAENVESILLHSITKSLSWSVFIACIYIISSIYNLSIHKIMKNVFVPLSRLSYSTILVYNVIQVYTTATMRVPEYVTFPRLVMMASSDIFASYASAFVLYLIIEGPTRSWINMVFGSVTKEPRNLVKLTGKEENNMPKDGPSL